MTNLSAVVLTYNEGKNIAECLGSIKGLTGEIFIVDSFSSDGTLDICRKFTDKIYQHQFQTHSQQWNWALRNLPFAYEWCLALDADQRATPELLKEIGEVSLASSGDIEGFYIKRRQIFRGRWIRHGGYYPKYLLKLFLHKKARCAEEEIIEHRFYLPGKTAQLQSDIIEDNKNEYDFSFWLAKHRRYAWLQAQEEVNRKKNKSSWPLEPSLSGNPDQQVLWMKSLYYRLPLFLRPVLYFVYRYFFLLGFLDAKEGLIFHFWQGLWYRFLVDRNIIKIRKGITSAREV